MSIRFIHAADLHLDRPFQNMSMLPEPLYERMVKAPFRALHTIISTAIERKVDFILFSGDLYDGANPSLRAEHRFYKEVQRLEPYDIPVYLIHGNHDPLDRLQPAPPPTGVVRFPSDVTLERFERPGKPSVHLYGFSYPTRHVRHSMTSYYKKIPGADFHIALLHGYLKGGRSDYDAYAPFEIQELVEKDMDYWALGHIHERQQLTPQAPIFYSGTPQGLSLKETGEKGVNLVTLSDLGCEVELIPTADFLFEEKTVDLTGIEKVSQLLQLVEELKTNWRVGERPGILRLNLEGISPLHSHLKDPRVKREVLEALQDGEETNAHFCWIVDFSLNSLPLYPRDQWAKESHFLGDLIRMLNNTETLESFLEDLYKHSMAKRDLEPIDRDQQESLLKEAEQLLVRGLMGELGEGGLE